MKLHQLVYLYLLLISNLINAQENTDGRLAFIKHEQEVILKNKSTYQKIVVDKSKDLYDNQEPDETIRKLIITYYLEKDEIKLITRYELTDHMFVQEYITNYYFNNGKLLFVVRTEKEIEWEGYDNLVDRSTKLIENLIFFDQKICIKYLIKTVAGPLSKIENLINKAGTSEVDCSNAEDYTEDSEKLILEFNRK